MTSDPGRVLNVLSQCQCCRTAGFENIDVREIATDPFNNYYIARK